MIGLLNCPITNCPITNCPDKFFKPITIEEIVIFKISLDIKLCQLKNDYSAPTGMGTPTFSLVIVINLS